MMIIIKNFHLHLRLERLSKSCCCYEWIKSHPNWFLGYKSINNIGAQVTNNGNESIYVAT